ncbi:MAG: hypothetical protein ABDI20_09935 [Candidatus Bipolaricaulaceae bacterium]
MAATLGYLAILEVPGFSIFKMVGAWGETRALAGFKDPNVYAAYLVPAILYSFHKLQFATRKLHVFSWSFVFGFLLANQFLGFSRAAYLNIFSASIIFCFLTKIYSANKLLRASIGLLMSLSFLILTFLLRPGLLSRHVERFYSSDTSYSCVVGLASPVFTEYDVIRFEVQRQIMFAILQNPWGIGPGRTEKVFGCAAHNLFLRIFIENGWVAGLCFLVFLGISLWHVLRVMQIYTGEKRSERAVLASALLGVLLNSLFIDTLHWRHFWLLLGLVWGADTVEVREGEESGEK